jgi:hypothetical protein
MTNTSFRASAPHEIADGHLGPLAELPGTWMGHGFNLIALPKNVGDSDEGLPFRVLLNSTEETLTVAPIGAPIVNRAVGVVGSDFGQTDIAFLGLHYLQRVTDALTHEALHLETGQWLNLPSDVQNGTTKNNIVRLATIPHGVSLIAQGVAAKMVGAPTIAPAAMLPMDANGNEVTEGYLGPYDKASLPPGVPAEAVRNPNLMLTNALAGQNIVETVILKVKAIPDGQSGDQETRDIANIPHLRRAARVVDFSAAVYIETVQQADGKRFMQLQYTQTIILNFERINWPHLTVATLVKQ